MTNFEMVDSYTDGSLVDDPFPYFEYLQEKCPVLPRDATAPVDLTREWGDRRALTRAAAQAALRPIRLNMFSPMILSVASFETPSASHQR